MGSNWRDANTTVAGGWGVDIDRLRVSGKVIDGGQYYVSRNPTTKLITGIPRSRL